MTFDEIVELYLDWALGRDDEVSQSDWMCACFDYGYSCKEIMEAADKKC